MSILDVIGDLKSFRDKFDKQTICVFSNPSNCRIVPANKNSGFYHRFKSLFKKSDLKITQHSMLRFLSFGFKRIFEDVFENTFLNCS